MAKIIFGSYIVRCPIGGMLASSLQWLRGFQQLGHDVYLVEKSGWPNSCFNPKKNVMGDDCSYGVKIVNDLLSSFELGNKWCYVDACDNYYGLDKKKVNEIFKTADLYIDWGAHGAWSHEASKTQITIRIEGEPGRSQILMENKLRNNEPIPDYDFYYSVGLNLGTGKSSAPTAGKKWGKIFHPVCVDLFQVRPLGIGASFTTVMNWQSHDSVEYEGKVYGQKDIEFLKFISLPKQVDSSIEIAVSGKDIPYSKLESYGWHIKNAHEATLSYNDYVNYIGNSKGEFSVCKNIFIETKSGWFSDRSAVYLACGRPVVLQDTGFSSHLPCGMGLFAVKDVEEAASAINEVNRNYRKHSEAAREIAEEFLDARKVLQKFLFEINV